MIDGLICSGLGKLKILKVDHELVSGDGNEQSPFLKP